jgi:hypothetical protein
MNDDKLAYIRDFAFTPYSEDARFQSKITEAYNTEKDFGKIILLALAQGTVK